ncbi:MAG: lipid-A-disaccharide synthase [Vicinamibacterales bacterium]
MNDTPLRVMLSCAEPSGDLYAGALTSELRARAPGTQVFGFGGDGFERAGGELLDHFRGLSVTGLTEALPFIPRFYGLLRRLKAAAAERRPDVFVAIDAPDFNFFLLRALKGLGIPVIYYISPQLWAWRARRMRTMQRFVDRVLVIFPFEEAIYEKAGVPVTFVGHPLVDMAKATATRTAFLTELGLNPAAPTLAILPGSRTNEVARIAPTMAGALPGIRAAVPDLQCVIACAPHLTSAAFDVFGTGPGAPARVTGRTDDVLAASDVVLTASGTATVQAALHEKPMVVVYRLSPLTYRLGKPLVRVDTYAMANLVAGERLVPELIQDDFTPQRVTDEVVTLLTSSDRHSAMRQGLQRVRTRLGAPGASGRAADAVLQVAREHRKNVRL